MHEQWKLCCAINTGELFYFKLTWLKHDLGITLNSQNHAIRKPLCRPQKGSGPPAVPNECLSMKIMNSRHAFLQRPKAGGNSEYCPYQRK